MCHQLVTTSILGSYPWFAAEHPPNSHAKRLFIGGCAVGLLNCLPLVKAFHGSSLRKNSQEHVINQIQLRLDPMVQWQPPNPSSIMNHPLSFLSLCQIWTTDGPCKKCHGILVLLEWGDVKTFKEMLLSNLFHMTYLRKGIQGMDQFGLDMI